MNLSLPPHIQTLIDDLVHTGRYDSAESLIAAAVSQLAQREAATEFDEGELDRLLAEGEQGGASLDGDEVSAELRALGRQGRSRAG